MKSAEDPVGPGGPALLLITALTSPGKKTRPTYANAGGPASPSSGVNQENPPRPAAGR